MIRIVMVDDHPVVRAGLTALLQTEEDLVVVGEAATQQAAVDVVAGTAPDLVLMDLRLGPEDSSGSGVAAIRELRERAERAGRAAAPVLVLTNYDSDADIVGAVEAGAAGYLLKDAPPEELVAGVRAAAAGETALAPAVASRLLARLRTPAPALSARELDVLRLVGEGLSNTGIAARLVVSEATVKSHLVHIFTKLDVGSRTAALAAARRAGLLD